jgi:hypothetical protein
MRESALVKIDLSPRAQDSTRAILWIRSDIEICHGNEVICTIRPREPFRPERLAILAACAGSFDLVDLKVARCSVFADVGFGPNIPAVQYATAYELRPRPDAWISGPHRAIVADETCFGLPIVSRVCPTAHDVSITARHRQDTPPAALEVLILGTVMSEASGYRTYLKEQHELEEAWRRQLQPCLSEQRRGLHPSRD